MPFDDLPGELYDVILSHVPESDFRTTILSLTRVLPYSGISTRRLFRDVCLKRPEQVVQFYQRLRSKSSIITSGTEKSEEENVDLTPTWVQTFSLESWTADAEIILNIVQLLPNLTRLTLWIGPTNFTPEHLEEMFDLRRKEAGSRCVSCVGRLEYLSLRFRPYVQTASYYQFLKGAYFDSALESISCWPQTNLPRLSIIQDPLTDESSTSAGSEVKIAPPSTSFSSGLPKRTLESGFAQPIVFFRLDTTVPELLRSDSLRLSATSLRLRLPGRSLVKSLLSPPPPNPPSFGAPVVPGSTTHVPRKYYPPKNAYLPPAPFLNFLDVSSSAVPETAIPLILARYPYLTHFIADDCAILRGELATRDGGRDWAKLAKECSLAGSHKAKDREKKIKAWLEEEKVAYEERDKKRKAGEGDSQSSGGSRAAEKEKKKSRRGRKGLATATISLKKAKNDATAGGNSETGGPPRPRADPVLFSQKIRILPPLPALRSFSTSFVSSSSTDPDSSFDVSTIHDQWDRGWSEGIHTLVQIRNRLRTSWRNGTTRVLRFATQDEVRSGAALDSSSRRQRPQTPEENSSSSRSPARSDISSSLSTHPSQSDEDQTVFFAEEGLGGLIDVADEQEFDVDLVGSITCANAPVLCLAGALETSDSRPGNSEGAEPGAGSANASGGHPSQTSQSHRHHSRPGSNLRVVRPHTEGCVHEHGRKVWLDSW
ncbi:hypothetical protein K435DRAFT_960495 [Dendrothele bispora CBS 962.96]|uniref:F-box domain-containing protein n=1 Tax=Dendrothele bispora (strain CBS 962.96) TaxID=1314807 RepID=A0A4S8MVR5_DENBC|nr:hypothetical protein K435DRAFT_960495 [Dendrothele bispora CBS 962.96]